MSYSSLDFMMVEKETNAKVTNLEIIPSAIMMSNRLMKNKLKRRRSTSSSPSSRRSSSSGVFGRRVKTLKGLIPNSHQCISIDGLFRETADYILALQLKVQVMQTMIDLLSNSGSH
ncbi:hypothetical protein QQ045_004056 [Rhodiola kirilowii]